MCEHFPAWISRCQRRWLDLSLSSILNSIKRCLITWATFSIKSFGVSRQHCAIIDNQPAAHSHISWVPAIEVQPDTMRHNFVIEMLNESFLKLTSVWLLLTIEQMAIVDQSWSLIEELRLVILIVLDSFSKCSVRALLVNWESENLVDLILLLREIKVRGLYTMEDIIIGINTMVKPINVILFVSVAEELISKATFRQGQAMFIHSEVHVVTPFRPPWGTDQKLAITQATEICLEHEWVLDLG